MAPITHKCEDLGTTSILHKLALTLVWLTLAVSAIVFTEPAPFDAMMLVLIWLLPLIGFVHLSPSLTIVTSLWIVIMAAGLLASTQATDIPRATTHTLITFYLAASAALLTAFIQKNPSAHSRLIMSGYLFAAILATGAAIIGYLNLIPSLSDLFTLYGRARGTFKDPNVFGAFLVPALIYSIYLWINSSAKKTIVPLALMLLFIFAILLSFSRGAWANLVVSLVVFVYLSFVTAQSNSARLKLVILTLSGICASIFIIAIALQFEEVSALLGERANLMQNYDVGPQGRFGGQLKALDVIISNPLGIGAREFGDFYHNEDTHNVYLSMFLNAGWLGGLLYITLILAILILGFKHCLRNTPCQQLLIVFYAAFAGIILEGFIIDSDHWRHFFVLIALVLGMMNGHRDPLIRH